MLGIFKIGLLAFLVQFIQLYVFTQNLAGINLSHPLFILKLRIIIAVKLYRDLHILIMPDVKILIGDEIIALLLDKRNQIMTCILDIILTLESIGSHLVQISHYAAQNQRNDRKDCKQNSKFE